MNSPVQNQSKKLKIDEAKIRTIEVGEAELAPRSELTPYDHFETVPPPAWGPPRKPRS